MKTHFSLPSCTGLFQLSRLCRFGPKARLLAAAFFLLFIVGFANDASAQATSNCVSVICPPSVITNITCDDILTPTNYPIVVSNHCPGVQVQVNCNPPPGTPLGLGANPIHCTVTANGQIVGNCDFTIFVVRDTTPPVIQCPTNIVVSSCPGPAGCGAVVTYPLPFASDNSGFVSVTCVPASGSVFPCGTTTVACNAQDRCNLQSSCKFDVTVQPNGAPPTIQCPPDITVDTCSNSAQVNFSATVTPAGTFVVCNPPSGSTFPPGISSVTCVASNGCGTAQCTFKVIVRTGALPVIQCPTNIFVTSPCSSNCTFVSYPNPFVTNGVSIGCTPPSGSCFAVGDTTVTCRATNNCGLSQCQFIVHVQPSTSQVPPTIQCPSNRVVNLPCGSNCVPVFYPPPSVINGFLFSCNPPSGSCFPPGVQTVSCFATNNCSSAQCSFTIQVIVGAANQPTIQCPSNVVVSAPCNSNCVPVSYPPPIVGNGVFAGCSIPSGGCFPIGVTTVTCSASNSCGGFASCQFDVRVIGGQGQLPSIQCQSNIVVTSLCNSNCTFVSFPNPIVSNGVFAGCTPPSGSCFPVGVTTVVCRATNNCGQSAQCQFDVRVQAGTSQGPPTIKCPTNRVVNLPCGSNCVTVFYPAPSVTNGFLFSCNPPSGSCFPAGTQTVNCFATNNCSSAACSFTIQVNGGTPQPPTIQCPTSNVVVALPCGSNCVSVFYALPSVFNGTLVGCTPPPGTCFPAGIQPVTCTATNTCGLSSSCTFNVDVRPSTAQPPIIRCPTNTIVLTIPCGSNCVPVTYPTPFVTNGVLVGCNPPPGTCLPAGVYNVLCRASNSCAFAECEFLVRVVENTGQPPVIQCPTNLVVVTTQCGSNCAPITYPLPFVTNGALASCTPPLGTCLPVGSYTIVCTATNSCGENKCEFALEVRPGQNAPTIQCPTNVTLRLGCSSNCIAISYPLPTVSNGTFIGCTPPLGTCLPLGDYVVTCRATNNCGLVSCQFIVHIVPLDPAVQPTIQCPTNIVVTAPCGSNCVTVFYPAPSVSNGTLQGCNPPSGTCFPIGVTTVNCRATNGCGGVADCKFDVRVVGGQGQVPDIRCPTNFTVALPCGSNCVPVFYPLPVVTNGVLIGCTPPSGTCFSAGNHLVTCFASNSCASASCEFIVAVVGQTAGPTIQCPSNIVATLPCGSNCVPVYYPSPIVSGGVFAGCTPPSGTCLPVGIYNVTCRATNNCGQSAACEFQIRVIQGTGQTPIIQCLSNLVVTAPCGSNCVPVFYPVPFVTNGVFAGCTPPSGTCFPIGTNFIVCRATNNCGSSTCAFRVTVLAGTGQGPILKCPTNFIVATVPCGSNCVPVFYPLPTVTNGTVSCNPPSGTCLPVGNHAIICTASNNCGQSQCEFVVQVISGQGHPPVITCPTNISVETCSPNCQVVNYPLPTVANGTLAFCTPPSGFCFPIGTTTVTCVATNSCGTNSCAFTVTVRPVPYPVIKCPSNIVVTTCGTGEIVNYPPPTLLGSASNVTVFCTPPSGSFFPVGTNFVRCCAVDRCFRTNCCEFLVIVRSSGNPCVKPPTGMVLWLPFDEPVGPIAANIIPGAPNGLHVNGPAPLLGSYVLNSLRFDGINDFVRVPNYAAIMLNASDFSIDAWVLRDVPDQGRRVIVSKLGQVAVAVGLRGYEYYLNNGVMNLALGGVVAQNFNSGVAVPADGNWHHVAVTVQRPAGGGVRFYLDGAVVNVQGGPITAPLGNNNALFVGAGTFPAPNAFFRGPIDEVEIFKRALTAAEVFSLWNAHQAGKCKIVCAVPVKVALEPGTCVTVHARICNNSSIPQTISWVAAGPVITTPQSGSFTLPPFTCTNIPVILCNPAGTPAGSSQPWTLSVSSETQCPMVCVGTVVNHGVVVIGPDDPTGIAGTNRTDIVRVNLNGLPPGSPVRLRVLDSDMLDDAQYVSLNGLPPGTPWELPGVSFVGGKRTAKITDGLDVPVRFADADPVGLYTILLEADTDGDGTYEPLASYAAENSVVSPPTIRLVNGKLEWDDLGDGFGTIESADSLDGPWTPIPGGPGTPIDTGGGMKFYRIAVPLTE